ncbi:Serine/threonine-protein kinase/endoribonuclease IRE1, partial [Tulasnella sp. UAMH 9824]
MRRATTKFVGQKATPTKARTPSRPAVRDQDPQLENKRKHSSDSDTSQQDVPSEPDAKRLKTVPKSSSEAKSPARGRSLDSDDLLANALSSSISHKPLDLAASRDGSTFQPNAQGDNVYAVPQAPGPRRLSEAVEGEGVASEEPSLKPKAQKIKSAGTTKPEIQPLREAEVPYSSGPKAKRLPALRTTGHENDSKKSFGLSDLKAVGDSPSLQLRFQDVATPALAQSSRTLRLFGAAGGNKTTPVDATSIAQQWIKFGTFRCLDDAKSSISLKAPAHGLSCYAELIVGRDRSRRVAVTGPYVGKQYGKLILEQSKPDKLPLRRRVRMESTDVANPISRKTLWKRQGSVQVGKPELLSDGDRVRFGDGPWFRYEPPKLFDLYKRQSHLYGDEGTNSRVLRIKRRCDNVSFVAKMIDRDHLRMADKELEALNILGYHPNITQLVEAFYDKVEGIDYLVLEASQKDLHAYVSSMELRRHRSIIDRAPQIIAQAANGIAHVHSLEMAHLDIKPENVLISINELGHIKISICDFGIARSGPQPTSKTKWEAGTPYWMAPASFMVYPHDHRLVDCYGIGRILYFL